MTGDLGSNDQKILIPPWEVAQDTSCRIPSPPVKIRRPGHS